MATTNELRGRVADLLRLHPEISYRALASKLDCHYSTIASIARRRPYIRGGRGARRQAGEMVRGNVGRQSKIHRISREAALMVASKRLSIREAINELPDASNEVEQDV